MTDRTIKLVFGVFLFFVVLRCIGFAFPPVDVMFFLAVGWVLFLVRVIPQVHMRWELAASAVVYAAVLLAGSQYFLRWLYREMTGGVWQWGWTLRGFALVLLMFVAGTGAVGAIHQVNWLARSPEPMFRAQWGDRANRVKCASNLWQIGQAMNLYAQEHGGQFPDDLPALILHADLVADNFVCPSTNDEKAPGQTPQEQAANLLQPGHCSFVYLAKGLTTQVESTRVLALEPLTNHEGEGINVLFADIHVEWLDKPSAEALLTKLGLEQLIPRRRAPASQRGR